MQRHTVYADMCKEWGRLLTGTPQLCVCVSGSPTGHRLHAAEPPSHESLRCHWSHTCRRKDRNWLTVIWSWSKYFTEKKIRLNQNRSLALASKQFSVFFLSFAFFILVDVVFNGQQVVAHSLEGQLMQDRRDGVKRPVQDDQLWASLIWTLQGGRNTGTGIKGAVR